MAVKITDIVYYRPDADFRNAASVQGIDGTNLALWLYATEADGSPTALPVVPWIEDPYRANAYPCWESQP